MSAPDVGAGFCPAGVVPAGWGSPATADGITGVNFPDPNDPTTSLDCRFIDPVTRQYVLGANGRSGGMTLAQQGMQLAMLTVLGTAVDATLGQSFSSMLDIAPNVQTVVTNAVNNACANLVARGLVQINSVTANEFKQNGELGVVRWTDLTTTLQHETSV